MGKVFYVILFSGLSCHPTAVFSPVFGPYGQVRLGMFNMSNVS